MPEETKIGESEADHSELADAAEIKRYHFLTLPIFYALIHISSQPTLSKSERTADIRLVFTRDRSNWVCNPCKNAGESSNKYTFRGGTSTLQAHISW